MLLTPQIFSCESLMAFKTSSCKFLSPLSSYTKWTSVYSIGGCLLISPSTLSEKSLTCFEQENYFITSIFVIG
jgi:hypothetical protein